MTIHVQLRRITLAAVVATAAAPGALPSTATADFGRPFTVTRVGEQFPNGFSGAVNASGASAFAWTQGKTVRLRFRRAGGRMNSVLTVRRTRRGAFVPRVALDRRGNAIVAWHEQTSSSSSALYAVAVRRGHRVGTPQRLGRSEFSRDSIEREYPLLSFSAAGEALLAWRYAFRSTSTPDGKVAVAWAAPNGRFGKVQRLKGVLLLSASFRSDGSGVLLAAGAPARIFEASAGSRGRFAATGTAFQPTPALAGIADLTAGEGPEGTLLAAWREGYAGDPGAGPDPGPVHAAVRTPGGGFSADEVISQPQPCGGVQSSSGLLVSGVVGTTGNALVSWTQCIGDPQAEAGRIVMARPWSPGTGWAPVAVLGSRDTYGPAVTLAPDGRGNLVMAWLADDRDIAVSVLDATGAFAPVTHVRSAGDARRTGPKVTAAGDQMLLMWGSGSGYQAAVGRVAR